MRSHPDNSTPRIDRATAERLLDHPGEAPDPSLEALARLLAAACHRTPGPLPREEAILEAFRAWAGERGTRVELPPAAAVSWPKRVAAVAAAAGLVLGGGVTAAAAGALPDGPQGVAEEVFAEVGIDIPGPEEPPTPAEPVQRVEPPRQPTSSPTSRGPRGGEVSDVATTTDAKGVDKGEEVSGTASEGKAGGKEKGNGARD